MTQPSNPDDMRAKIMQYFHDGNYEDAFELVYKNADQNPDVVPWANATVHPRFSEWLEKNDLQGDDKRAIVLGSGLGDDAEKLSELGFHVTAFDVSLTAINWAKKRFPDSKVDYHIADLFDLPPEWHDQFDFVLEIYTVQSLKQSFRTDTLNAIVPLLKTGGQMLLICMGREHEVIPQGPPWAISMQELQPLVDNGLTIVQQEDFVTDSGTRHFRILYQK